MSDNFCICAKVANEALRFYLCKIYISPKVGAFAAMEKVNFFFLFFFKAIQILKNARRDLFTRMLTTKPMEEFALELQ